MTNLGYAVDAIFSGGVLCALEDSSVRILDLYGGSDEMKVSIRDLVASPLANNMGAHCNCIQLLSYHKGTLAFRYSDLDGSHLLMAVDISNPRGLVHLFAPEPLRSCNKLFVLQTSEYLFYGTHSARATWQGQAEPFHEWLIRGIALRGGEFTTVGHDRTASLSRSQSIQLYGCTGSEIGSTVAFTIHDGYFYAVSSYDAPDVIEIDFTSYYHCTRFPLKDARQSSCQVVHDVFRRQHRDGPLHDGWNTLDLQIDEESDELLIVEGRAEWSSSGRNLSRGIYTHKVNWDEQAAAAARELYHGMTPIDEAFSQIPDPETKYSPTPVLPIWHKHMEKHHLSTSRVGHEVPTLMRSKFRGYNFSSMSFLELGEQSCNCRGAHSYCLRLRSFSRRLIPVPLQRQIEPSAFNSKANRDQDHDQDEKSAAPAFAYSTVKTWPEKYDQAHEIMNLPERMHFSRSTKIKAWMDERSIVYLISAGSTGKLVCLCFDGDASVARLTNAPNNPLPIANPVIRDLSPPRPSYPEHCRTRCMGAPSIRATGSLLRISR